MRRLLLALALGCSLSVATLATPAGAITDGTVDGGGHPNVAVITFYMPDGRFRCSATLVSPTVLVTAAHCTQDVIGRVLVSFAPTMPTRPRATDDPGDGTSAIGYQAGNADWATGTAHAHPLYDGKLQLNDLHDVGVVVLDSPVDITPAALAPRAYLEGLPKPLSKQVFTTAGYGIFFQKAADGPQKPDEVNDGIRRTTTEVGQNLSSQVLKLAENAKDSRAEGGTCFGDSGGPAFHGGYLVADTSFGASQYCRSAGGFYRLDTDDARGFLDDYVAVP